MSDGPGVRPARPQDARAIAAVHVRAWHVGYRGLVADRALDALAVDERTAQWREHLTAPRNPVRTLVAEQDGAVCGFVSVHPSEAELPALYVDPGAWRRGIGTALLVAAFDVLRVAGADHAVLGVLRDNARARAFYATCGFAPTGDERPLDYPSQSGAPLVELRVRAPLRRPSFGTWPTPLDPAPRLAERLGLAPGDLQLKRDDLVGLGGGGNKARKLEHLCARALDARATVLVTSGGPQSNHARLTAAAAARLGVRAVLVLAAADPGAGNGNLALDGLLGAEVVWAGAVDSAALDAAAARVAGDLRARGERVALLPLGGSDAVGARGYTDCAAELRAQAPDAAHVVCAVGSGGTMAGLVAGLGPARVLGVDVGAVPDAADRVTHIARGLGAREVAPLRLRTDQVGEGYGVLTPAARAALADAARTEGVLLDPVYTAKALAGLAAAVRDGDVRPGEPVVFVHTGGLPGLFGHPVAAEFTIRP